MIDTPKPMPSLVQRLAIIATVLVAAPLVLGQASAKADDEVSARARAVEQGVRRMAPLPHEQWSDAQRAANALYRSARHADVKSGLFMDLLRAPEMMAAAFQMRLYVQEKISFGDKLSALAMLVTLREWNQRQEFGGHAREAVRYGLKAEIVQAIAEGRRPPSMDDDESLIYDFATELLHNHNISDVTYNHMVERFGERGVIEGITLINLYSLVGMTYDVVREPVPDGYPPLPDFPQSRSNPLSAYETISSVGPPRPPAPPPAQLTSHNPKPDDAHAQ